jgi:hypothetical protein
VVDLVRARVWLSAVSLLVACGVVPMAVLPVPAAVAVVQADDEVSFEWTLVEFLEQADPRPLIRAGAQQALATGDPVVVARFFDQEYPYLVEEAALMAQLDRELCDLVLDSITEEDAPAVYVAAKTASMGSDRDRELFVRSGYAAAQQRDRVLREDRDAQARALVEADRAFVRQLALTDPGEQVRLLAAFATRPMAEDRDLAEFFEFGWMSGGRLDLERFRLTNARNEVAWRMRMATLVADARAAEAAALHAADEVAEQLRAAAVRAWRQVGEQAGPARTAWSDAQHVAETQARSWVAVAEAAASGAIGPSWAVVAGPAQANGAEWAAEGASATQQVGYWQTLVEQATEGELRIPRST